MKGQEENVHLVLSITVYQTERTELSWQLFVAFFYHSMFIHLSMIIYIYSSIYLHPLGQQKSY